MGARVEEYWETICPNLSNARVRMTRCSYLGVKRGCRGTEQSRLVLQIDWRRELLEVFDRFSGRFEEGLRNDGGVHAFLQHLLCSTEKASSQDDDRGGTVTSLYILSSRKVDQLMSTVSAARCQLLLTDHLRSGMESLDTLQNSRTVVGDDDLSFRCLDLHIDKYLLLAH